MFTILKKLFAKSEPKAVATVTAPQHHEPSAPVPTVEVAHLSLTAIISRLGDDLKATVRQSPDPAATVALPIQTILKQLPNGAVKMSLASLVRQAPGIFGALPPGDKRTVEIPLAEVFRHVRVHALKRRADQRPAALPEEGFNLFGNSANPFELAPAEAPLAVPQAVLDHVSDGPRTLKMDDGMREHFSSAAAARAQAPADSSPAELKVEPQRIIPPPPDYQLSRGTAETNGAAPPADGPPLILPLAPLTAHWPEDIRAETEAFDPATTVALPVGEITAGLAKGRVIFTWGQLLMWLEPLPAAPTAAAPDTALQLPLKIVAPAFLSASKQTKAGRKNVELDESIPALFCDGRSPAAAVETPAPVAEPAEQGVEPVAEVVPEPAPVAAAVPNKVPATVGEVFGEPTKTDWTPAEIVQRTVHLAGVAGAIVALQEGLQVATSLPEGVKSDVVAAFLPQIFARLNQYAGEMKLGEVDDLLFTTHGAHCQIYRLGYVYFAVLGKPGESLPWHELRLISEELARQTSK